MQQHSAPQLSQLLTQRKPPCVSFYQPTHRHHPDNAQDPIRYRNMLGELKNSLQKCADQSAVRSLMKQFEALTDDRDFWNHRTAGLAIFAAPEEFQVFELPRPVPQRIVVADSFHIKPLLRILQSADRYQILCLNRREARLFEGNRDALDPVKITEFPDNLADALGKELTEPHLTVASYGSGAGVPGQAQSPGMHHGHGGRKDEIDIDTERFFRVIDRGIHEHHSKPSGLPLLLAAASEYHAPFRAVSQNSFLLPEGVVMNFKQADLSLERLREEAWEKMEPNYQQRLATLLDDYQVAKSRHLGSNSVSDVAAAAVAGRIGTLLVEADRQIPGRIKPDTGQLEPGDMNDSHTDDLLDDLAEMTLRMQGQVVIVPADQMPTTTGLAAVYRY